MKNTIITEKNNPDTVDIDISSALDTVRMINREDLKIAQEVSKSLEDIAAGIELISSNFLKGGRLFYFGAGTSGRLGVLDASECPPTFNVPYDMVQGVIAGGDKALRFAAEGAEDSIELAEKDFGALNITPSDTVTVISASGNAQYCVHILKLAREKGVKTIAIVCNKQAEMLKYADIKICVETGAEAIAGSTRMKAGTAQKMVLNMLSTGAMVKIGKTYKNFMADVKPSNIKLKDRAVRIAAEIAEKSEDEARSILEKNNYNVKEAVLQLKYSISFEQAQKLLKEHSGVLRKVFAALDK